MFDSLKIIMILNFPLSLEKGKRDAKPIFQKNPKNRSVVRGLIGFLHLMKKERTERMWHLWSKHDCGCG